MSKINKQLTAIWLLLVMLAPAVKVLSAQTVVSPATPGMAAYEIGSIPPWLDAAPGVPMQVQFSGTNGGAPTFSVTVDSKPAPKGTVTIDAKTGVLTYTADATDRFQFTVTVTAKLPGKADDTQSFDIRVHYALPPQTQLISPPNTRPLPNPADTAYMLVTQTTNTRDVLFNGVQQKQLRSVQISGKKVVFGGNPDLQNMARFNGKSDIESLDIYAEEVSITGKWNLPGTKLRIWARMLRREDAGSAISTTPLAFGAKGTTVGLSGQAGGDVELHLKELLPADGTVWIFTDGSRGQDATGNNRPGDGGPGGKLSSNLPVSKNWQGSGGQPGTKTNVAANAGSNGTFATLTGDAARWMTWQALGQSLAYATDAYRNSNIDYAQAWFSQTLGELSALSGLPDDAVTAFSPLRSQVTAANDRLGANLDYFGHPGPWTTPLSLTVSLDVYNAEIAACFRTMYLAFLLQKVSDSNKKDVVAMQDTIAQAKDQVARDVDALTEAQGRLVSLGSLAVDLASQEKALMDSLNTELKRVQAQATPTPPKKKKKSFWKKALSIVSKIAQFIPVAQPLLSVIGTGISFMMKPNINTALDFLPLLPGLGSVTSDVFGAIPTSLQARADDISKFVTGLKPTDGEATDAYIKRVAGNLKGLNTRASNLRDSLTQARNDIRNQQQPSAEIAQQFEALKATDSALKAITDQIDSLNQKKVQLNTDTDAAAATIAAKVAAIETNLAAITRLGAALDDKVTVLDAATLQVVQDMNRAARERLFYYHYLVSKAYEYRFLRPYPNQLDLTRITDKVVSMLDAGGYVVNSPTAFDSVKALFTDQIGQIAATGISEILNNPPERSVPLHFSLTKPQLDALNAVGEVWIDLVDVIGPAPYETNRLLSNLTLESATALYSSPSPCCRVRLAVAGETSAIRQTDTKTFAVSFATPAIWGGVLDVASGRVDNETVSNAQLAFLANITGRSTADMDSWVRPPADMRIRIQRIADPVSLPVTLTKVTFGATVDYTKSSTNRAQLNVLAADAGTPLVLVQEADLGGMTDGRGRFQRIYQPGTTVHLTAEPRYADSAFVKWVDGNGLTVATTSAITMVMNGAKSLKPVYTPPLTLVDDGTGTTTAAPILTLQDIMASPTVPFDMTMSLALKGFPAAQFQADCAYDTNVLKFNSAKAGDALLKSGKQLGFNAVAADTVRVVGFGADLGTFTDGTAALLNFTMASSVPTGFKSLVSCSNAIIANPTGGKVTAITTSGTVTSGGCSCDLDKNGVYDVRDIAVSIRQILGLDTERCDLNGDGVVTIADATIVINSVLGKGCAMGGAK